MKTVCNRLGYILLIGGAIGTFLLAKFNGRVVDITTSYAVYYKRDMGLTIYWIVVGVISTVLSSVIFFALAEILETLETLEYYAAQASTPTRLASENEKQRILNDGGWTCKKCGRVNSNVTGTCACGGSKE